MIVLNSLILVLVLFLAYLFCIHPGSRPIPEDMQKNYAHRGLYGGDVPENSLKAFENAVNAGYGIELDVQLSCDGEVVVFHDATLDRMTGVHGKVIDYTLAQLKTMELDGSEHRIPTLREVLALVDGKVPLLVELKGESTDTSVCPAADEILREYSGSYLIESFNPLLLRWYKKNHPDVLRGQLTTNLSKGLGKNMRNRLLDSMILNLVTRPDFLAYDIRCPKRFPVRLCTGLFHANRFVWTVRDRDEYSKSEALDAFAIFENFCPPITLNIEDENDVAVS
ncbi:MAG: glycerophosphodiester phosphodiesterase [Ruminococcaceae bacterium]|nr:glycerophosphodiester phosphodiesterase [Oscillospiraceae bacterium]